MSTTLPTEGEIRSIKTEPSLRRVNQASHKSPQLQNPRPPLIDLNNAKTVLSPLIGQFVINTLLQAAAFAVAIAFGVFAIRSVDKADINNQYAAQALEEARIANQIAIFVLCTSQNPPANSFCARVQADVGIVFPSVATALFTNSPSASTSATLTSSSPSTSATPTNSTILGGGAAPTNFVSSTPISTPLYSVGATPSTAPSSASPNPNSNAISSGAIAGVVIGASFALLVVVALIFWTFKRRSRRSFAESQGAAVPELAGNQTADASAPVPENKSTSSVMPGETDISTGGAPIWPKSRTVRWWQATRTLFLDSTVSTREN